MSEPVVAAPVVEAQGLNQWQRVGNTLTAPAKTFAEIQGGRKSWWLPFVILTVVTYILFAAIALKVGWHQVAENAITQNPKAVEKLAQATPAQRDSTIQVTEVMLKGSFAATPVIILLSAAVVAAVLLATINFVFAGKASFGAIFTVWMYASLPSAIKSLLGVAVAWFTAPESFNIKLLAPTNIAAFLSPTETNAAVYALLSSIDVITIWSLILLGIGLSAVAGVKRSAGYIAVFGWWALIVLASVGYAAIAG